MSNLKGRGIILKKTKYAEADLILQILMSSGQRLSVLAKGALRSKKRFGGGILEPTHFIELEYRPGKAEGLAILNEAVLLEDFAFLRLNYEKIESALFAISIATKISQEGDTENVGLFNLLGNYLRFLQKPEKQFDQWKAVFSLKVLFQQGVLEIEPWMKTYLHYPLTDMDLEKINMDASKIFWCLDAIRNYQI